MNSENAPTGAASAVPPASSTNTPQTSNASTALNTRPHPANPHPKPRHPAIPSPLSSKPRPVGRASPTPTARRTNDPKATANHTPTPPSIPPPATSYNGPHARLGDQQHVRRRGDRDRSQPVNASRPLIGARARHAPGPPPEDWKRPGRGRASDGRTPRDRFH